MNGDLTFDVIVIGSGAAGLTTAVVAAHHGLSVLVVEKAETFGGTTARSGGVAWIPNNRHMAAAGLADSADHADAYLRSLMGNLYDEERVSAYLRSAPDMASFMEDNSAVRFDNWHSLDYEPSREGAARGRSLGAAEFDGRRLGKDLHKISAGLPNLTILGGMQVAYGDVDHFAKTFRKVSSFKYTAAKFGRYVKDLLVHGRATRLVGGNALVGALLLSAREKGVVLWPSTSMTALHLEHGAARGIEVLRGNSKQLVLARRGVVLASGGYGGNDAMRRAYLPLAEPGHSLQPATNVGDGIRAGEKAGGRLVEDNIANGIWAAFSTRKDRDGHNLHHPHIFRDRAFPGFLMVDNKGRRFVNEGVSYQELGNIMGREDMRSAWLLCSHAALRRYGMGHVKPAPLPYRKYINEGYLKKGRTIAALALQINIDPATLEQTVKRFNSLARAGSDADFGKGADPYTSEQGDPEHRPNTALGALDQGPFYATKITPGDFSTVSADGTWPCRHHRNRKARSL